MRKFSHGEMIVSLRSGEEKRTGVKGFNGGMGPPISISSLEVHEDGASEP